MQKPSKISISITMILVGYIYFTIVGCDSSLGLKSKIQKEFNSNPFLKELNIKLTVLKEENGYVTVATEVDENDLRKYKVVNDAIDAAKAIKGVKAISLKVQSPLKKRQTARRMIELLGTALDTYKLDVGHYPESLNLLIETGQKKISKWNGPYLAGKSIPKDPWENDFVYKCPGNNSEYDLSSYGEDGEKGGEGINQDINSWEVDYD